MSPGPSWAARTSLTLPRAGSILGYLDLSFLRNPIAL